MMCNGNTLRAASSTAQPKARSLVGEPSTPTTMAPGGMGLLLMACSLCILGSGAAKTARHEGVRTGHLVPRGQAHEPNVGRDLWLYCWRQMGATIDVMQTPTTLGPGGTPSSRH